MRIFDYFMLTGLVLESPGNIILKKTHRCIMEVEKGGFALYLSDHRGDVTPGTQCICLVQRSERLSCRAHQ